MSDVYDKKKRSAIMRHIRSKGNKSTEIKLIEVFRELNITGWRRGYPVKGRPDFVFTDKKIAVFVDGCFWHGHDCRNTRPEENKEFWQAKRERNMRRDTETTVSFEARSWTVLRIWECELKKKNRAKLNDKLRSVLKIGG